MSLSLFKRSTMTALHTGHLRAAPFTALRAGLSSSVVEEAHPSQPPPAPESGQQDSAASSAMPWVKVFKREITQSPKKVRFLLKLVRGAWVPDALAQMKFSPKHKAEDLAAIIRRGSAILKARHDLIPEQLMISEVLVTKGKQQKQMTIMGRGRTGFGYRRWSHIFVRLEQINFEKQIENAETASEKVKWGKMAKLVDALRETPEQFDLKPRVQHWKNWDAYDYPKAPRSR